MYLLGFKEGIRERDFISVLKEGIVHIIRVNVEKDWHVNLKKFVNNTQILNLGNNSESVSIRLIPLPQDLVSVLQSRSTVFY